MMLKAAVLRGVQSDLGVCKKSKPLKIQHSKYIKSSFREVCDGISILPGVWDKNFR
jgi:hypothetical protein